MTGVKAVNALFVAVIVLFVANGSAEAGPIGKEFFGDQGSMTWVADSAGPRWTPSLASWFKEKGFERDRQVWPFETLHRPRLPIVTEFPLRGVPFQNGGPSLIDRTPLLHAGRGDRGTASVPEPGTMVLLAMGLGFAAIRRRRTA